jgi:PIN domain nuclease of toxin-antitoxin system
LIFLADACALIVFHGFGAAGMSTAGKRAMEDGDVFVSAITVWEITRKIALGKLARPTPPGFIGSFSASLEQSGYRPVPLDWQAAEAANALPEHHKDPMDRMLIAIALGQGLTIVSNDGVFTRYGVPTIW